MRGFGQERWWIQLLRHKHEEYKNEKQSLHSCVLQAKIKMVAVSMISLF
jgi:hypothetical protein